MYKTVHRSGVACAAAFVVCALAWQAGAAEPGAELQRLGVHVVRATDGTVVSAQIQQRPLQNNELSSALAAASSLRELTIIRNDISLDLLDAVRTLPKLERLYISGSKLGEAAWNSICEARGIQRLICYDFDLDRADLSKVALLRDLKEIQFTFSSLKGANTSTIGSLPKLRDVLLMKCDGDDQALIGMLTAKQLRILFISSSGFSSNVMRAMPLQEIEQLDISYEPHCNDKCVALLDGCSKLTRLRLHKTAISDEGVKTLMRSRLPSLARLDLGRNAITAAGIGLLTAMPSTIPALSLAGVSLDSASIESLSSIRGIADLDLEDTGLTDEALEDLSRMSWLRRL